jgi:hypothetical protein
VKPDFDGGNLRFSRGVALLGAFLLSFAVHLIPLFHVHAGLVPLGLIFAGVDELSALSLAAIAAALVLQGLAFGLFYWMLRGLRWHKAVVLIVAVPVFVFAANWGFLYAIPYLVLVERDSTTAHGELEKVCSVADATVAQVQSGVDLGLVRAGEVWVIVEPERKRARLTMPDCRVVPVTAPRAGSTMDHVARGGFLLYREDSGGLAYAAPNLARPLTLSAPQHPSYWNPVLSDDGATLVWLDREPAQHGQRPYRLRLRHLPDGREETIPLDLSPRDQFEVIGAASGTGPFTLAQFRNRILSIDIDGKRVGGPVSPPDVYDARWGFRWVDEGWVAWDGYREKGRSRIVWALSKGQGDIPVPRGRGIDSVSIAADGSVIAVSVSSNLNLGTTKSLVFLVRTADGEEIFRRYRPAYTRTRLAFLGSDYLAMSRSEGGRSFVDVYRISKPAGAKDREHSTERTLSR